jgi:hypothetical protein
MCSGSGPTGRQAIPPHSDYSHPVLSECSVRCPTSKPMSRRRHAGNSIHCREVVAGWCICDRGQGILTSFGTIQCELRHDGASGLSNAVPPSTRRLTSARRRRMRTRPQRATPARLARVASALWSGHSLDSLLSSRRLPVQEWPPRRTDLPELTARRRTQSPKRPGMRFGSPASPAGLPLHAIDSSGRRFGSAFATVGSRRLRSNRHRRGWVWFGSVADRHRADRGCRISALDAGTIVTDRVLRVDRPNLAAGCRYLPKSGRWIGARGGNHQDEREAPLTSVDMPTFALTRIHRHSCNLFLPLQSPRK